MEAIEGSTSPNAMINDLGDYFYPDSIDDAATFADENGAYPLDGAAFAQWLRTEELGE